MQVYKRFQRVQMGLRMEIEIIIVDFITNSIMVDIICIIFIQGRRRGSSSLFSANRRVDIK